MSNLDFAYNKKRLIIYCDDPKKDPIQTGYIPVEYNHYKELIEKAAKYDRIQDYISKMEKKDADI